MKFLKRQVKNVITVIQMVLILGWITVMFLEKLY